MSDPEGLREALDAAQEALFDIYLHEGPLYGVGIVVRPGGTIREKIDRFNIALQALAASPVPLDVERLAVVEAMERDGVVQWGDDGHRERFLAMLPVHLAALAASPVPLDVETLRRAIHDTQAVGWLDADAIAERYAAIAREYAQSEEAQ